ncbi:MAG TPA: hypothetical protein VK203_06115, partial [Nostocaceae cyanobacterium]|nr:hypothetical protein [Nostocaceae cyanobacterium]
EDLTDLDYRQLLALAGLIIATDRQPIDADYDIEDVADDEQLELPTYLLHHIAKIGRVGRAKFLVDVANALANLARPVEDEQETEILSPAQPESTND